LDNHRSEKYQPPKEEKKFHAFTGLRQSLSGVNTQGFHVEKTQLKVSINQSPLAKLI